MDYLVVFEPANLSDIVLRKENLEVIVDKLVNEEEALGRGGYRFLQVVVRGSLFELNCILCLDKFVGKDFVFEFQLKKYFSNHDKTKGLLLNCQMNSAVFWLFVQLIATVCWNFIASGHTFHDKLAFFTKRFNFGW